MGLAMNAAPPGLFSFFRRHVRGGKDDDGYRALGGMREPIHLERLDAVHLRHPDIEQGDIEAMRVERIQRLLAVLDR